VWFPAEGPRQGVNSNPANISAGGKVKVTPEMAGKWVKAAFLALLGFVLLIYGGKFVDELQTFIEDEFHVAFDLTWDLLMILIWILVAWLFVDAALTVAISFSEHKYNLHDVMKRLDRIERRLAPAGVKTSPEPVEMEEEAEAPPEVTPAEEEPPPPRE